MPEKKSKKTSKKKSSDKAKKLDRSKLHHISLNDKNSDPEENSLRVIIVLIVVIILVAVGGAYFVKNIQKQNEQPENVNEDQNQNEVVDLNDIDTEDPKPLNLEPTLEDIVINDVVEEDEKAENAPNDEDFITESYEISNETETEYILESVKVQPYETFLRVNFTFNNETTESEEKVPYVYANFRDIVSEIEISFDKTIGDNSGFEDGDTLVLEDSVMSSIVKSRRSSEMKLIYQLKISEITGYYLQVVDNQIILDIKEPEPREVGVAVLDVDEEEVTEESATDEQDMEEETDSEEEDVSEEEEDTVEITEGSKQITSSVEGNVAGIKGYSYDDTSEAFIYRLLLSNDKIPNVTSSIGSDGKVTIKIKNLSLDAVATDEEASYVDFVPNGVIGVQSVSASHSGGTSTYEFTMDSKMDYKVELSDAKDKILIKFMH
ncbi:hypothetical protein GF362_07020 [Candidatus Dojkabacteria bacterium]|nr:hypothetical protein [Candidatus Dojkabacteria bacterium]